MTKRMSLALVLVLLTFAPVAIANGDGGGYYTNPLAGIADWFKGIATAIAQVTNPNAPAGPSNPNAPPPTGNSLAASESEMGGFIGPQGEPQSNMGGHMDPFGGPQNDPGQDPNGDGGDDEMGGYILPNG